jgi:hypothetical protein
MGTMATLADTYTRILKAVELISQGKTPTAACIEASISYPTFIKHIKNVPELQDAYVEAEQMGLDTLADVLLRITTDDTYGETDAKMAKVVSENIKWYLSRKRPTQYGDKLLVEHKITLDRIITDAIDAGKRRALGYTPAIDVTPTVVEEPQRVVIPPELAQFF